MRLKLVWRLASGFLASLLLVVWPYPFGPSLRLLGYHESKEKTGTAVQFCSLGNFVCLAHLIFAGWMVGLFAATNAVVRQFRWAGIPMEPVTWSWLLVLILTLAVLSFQVDRYVLFMLVSWLVIICLAFAVTELASHIPLTAFALHLLWSIPISIDWGIPILVSASLGVLYAGSATWSRMNNRWSVPHLHGNEIHHHNFERRDRSIYRPGRTFVADYPCLLRKYLFFGYGNIEVRSSAGREMDHIGGVVFAEHYARKLVRDQLVHTNTRLTDELDVIVTEELDDDPVESVSEVESG